MVRNGERPRNHLKCGDDRLSEKQKVVRKSTFATGRGLIPYLMRDSLPIRARHKRSEYREAELP